MAESGFEAGPRKLAASVGEFVGANEAYYAREFEKIQAATKFPWTWNTMAAVAGPLWGPARGLWGFFLDIHRAGAARAGTDRPRTVG